MTGVARRRIEPMAETADSVTLRRVDFELLLDALEDADDQAALAAAIAEDGVPDHRWLPSDVIMRFVAGEAPLRVVREHFVVSLDDLATSGIAADRLRAIDAGAIPDPGECRRLAACLQIDADQLTPWGQA